MKVVFIKKNKFKKYKLININGYNFKPKNKNINSLKIINKKLIKKILTKKINKEINKASKAIRLMLKSNVTEESDCNIMINELIRISSNIEKKYMHYFDAFEYYNLIKSIYFLNMEIIAKKKLLEDEM